jgi:hypothetical protein
VPWQIELPSPGSYHLETVSILQLPVGLDKQLMDTHVLCYLGLPVLTSQQIYHYMIWESQFTSLCNICKYKLYIFWKFISRGSPVLDTEKQESCSCQTRGHKDLLQCLKSTHIFISSVSQAVIKSTVISKVLMTLDIDTAVVWDVMLCSSLERYLPI